MQTISAIFEDGVLKPAQPLNLPQHSHVLITIEELKPIATKEERLAALRALFQSVPIHPGEHLTRDRLHERG